MTATVKGKANNHEAVEAFANMLNVGVRNAQRSYYTIGAKDYIILGTNINTSNILDMVTEGDMICFEGVIDCKESIIVRMGSDMESMGMNEPIQDSDRTLYPISIKQLFELVPDIMEIEIDGKNEETMQAESIYVRREESGCIAYSEVSEPLVGYICLDCLANSVQNLIAELKVVPDSYTPNDTYEFYQTIPKSYLESITCENDTRHNNFIIDSEWGYNDDNDIFELMCSAVKTVVNDWSENDESTADDNSRLAGTLKELILSATK
jgi:hypothetical protein